MREIKFRAWDGDTKEMIPNSEMMIEWFDYHESDEDFTVMQFTGLLDRTGREIYEGDLVVCYLSGARIGVVDTILYNDESAAFEFKRRYTTIKAFMEHDGLYDTEIEVIGNIYETPELENA